MTIFSNNTIFQPSNNYIKFGNTNISVQNGANVLSKLPLCNIKIDYKQYQRNMVTVPAEQEDYLLSFPMMGIKSTFLAIKATYKNQNKNKNFLKWNFVSSNDPKRSFTNILVFSATSSNPIEPILIDNLGSCDVELEILIAGVTNDFLSDINSFIYIDNLEFTDVRTFDETNSEIFAFYNSDNELVATTNTSDVVNWYKVSGMNRIVIDESSDNNIILDFKTNYDTLQALSAINWLMLDPANRALPKAADLDPPVITLLTSSLTIDLANYSSQTYTKADFIAEAIDTIIDAIDGSISAVTQNIKFFDSNSDEVLSINSVDTYTGEITISDIAGNTATATVTIDAQLNIVDTTPPVINYTSEVDTANNTINGFSLSTDYGGLFTTNDAIIYSILSVDDDVDGPISLTDVNVVFYDSTLTQVVNNEIITAGTYYIEFSVSDSSLNTTLETFEINITA